MTPRSTRAAAAAALVALAAALAPSGAGAVGTRTFELTKLADLEGGDLTGVALDSRGHLRAGFDLGKLPITGADTTWSALPMPDGSVLIGTGNEGKVARVSGGQATFVATTGQMAVSALAAAWNGDAVAGTFPSGKLYRLGKAFGATAVEAKPFAELAGAEYVWGLAFDAKARALYAATGPEGKVFRVDEGGRAQVHYDAEDAHVVSIAVAPDGTLYAGTAGKALLLRITAAGRADVVHDFEGDDVSAIATAQDGTLWAASNKYTGGFSPPAKKAGLSQPGPSGSKPGAKSGEGVLYRFAKGRSPEQMLESKKAHLTSLTVGDDGRPYVGTGSEGRVYSVDDDHVESLLADVESRQVSAIVVAGNRRFVVGSDPATYHEVRGLGGADATWTSKALDAGLRASWGKLSWTTTGPVELQTRSGNTAEPDATWSPWSNALAAPGQVTSPPGRFIQLRGRWSRDPKAVVSDLKVHFVTENARAVVTKVDATSVVAGQGEGLKTGIVASGGKLAKPSSSVKVKWEVDNPDKDELRFRVVYRKEGQNLWRDALKPGDVYTKTELEWDTTALPEGTYRVRVEATDEFANPPDRVTRHVLESGPILVDNTPPLFRALALQGRRLTGEAVDGLGPIARLEIAVAGTDDWRPLAPTDGIFDQDAERFDVDVSSIVPAGNWIVAVRAYDAGGNSVSKELEAR